MDYQTFPPHPDLNALVKCYWTLEVPADADSTRQRIVPDGCIELIFILADDVRRYVSDTKFIIQPRAMVLGQITEPFYVEPTGHVHSFAVRFYPYGFSNFVSTPIKVLANNETPLVELFGESANELERKVINAKNTAERIAIADEFLLNRFHDKSTIDSIVK